MVYRELISKAEFLKHFIADRTLSKEASVTSTWRELRAFRLKGTTSLE
jgi:hypothetical protein